MAHMGCIGTIQGSFIRATGMYKAYAVMRIV